MRAFSLLHGIQVDATSRHALESPGLQFLRELQDDIEPSRGGRVGQSSRERHVYGIDVTRGSAARQHAER
jgi:hypothetical protein